jgi:hypothetical protein
VNIDQNVFYWLNGFANKNENLDKIFIFVSDDLPGQLLIVSALILMSLPLM